VSDIHKANEFVRMAREDYVAAEASSVPYSICFHAQQAAEKYLKAFLAFHGVPIPKTHDLDKLVKSCTEIAPSFANLATSADALRLFGVEIRYQPSKEEAEKKCPEAWTAFLAISDEVKKHLPSEALKYE
jgi:HEPN domain-containing protein